MNITPGSIMRKKEGAGFVGESLQVKIPEVLKNEDLVPCWCEDKNCKEYNDLEVIDILGNSLGYIYHVSQHELESI